MRLFILFIFILLKFSYSLAIDTKAEQAVVLDFSTNEILYQKNSNASVHPASMTKIMTVYVVFDRLQNTNLSIEDTCLVSPKAYKMGGSRMFLEIDDKVSINDLLRGIIIHSGNDASVAIAECLSGTESDFAQLMNVYSKKIGLTNTNFINSSGWPDKNHYSSVRDIAIISQALIRDFPELYVYFSEKEFTYNDISQPNRNKLLNNFRGADGLKTGFVKSSGWGIAASAIRDERRIIVVINGTNSSRSRLNESTNLLKWAFTQTTQTTLLKKDQIIKTIDVWLGNKPNINLIVKDDVITTLSFDQLKLIKSQIKYEKPASAPFNKGDKLGTLIINIPGKDQMQIPLVAETNIKSINPIFRIFAAIKYLIFGTSLDEI